MPALANRRGSMRSESRPARGEKTAIITGWIIKSIPALLGGMPLRDCKYRLMRKVTAKEAE